MAGFAPSVRGCPPQLSSVESATHSAVAGQHANLCSRDGYLLRHISETRRRKLLMGAPTLHLGHTITSVAATVAIRFGIKHQEGTGQVDLEPLTREAHNLRGAESLFDFFRGRGR